MTLQRASAEFGQEIKRRADADEREPDEQQVVRQPPADHRLHHAARRMVADQKQICGAVAPYKPQQRGEQEPRTDRPAIGGNADDIDTRGRWPKRQI